MFVRFYCALKNFCQQLPAGWAPLLLLILLTTCPDVYAQNGLQTVEAAGGVLSPATSTVVAGAKAGSLTLSGYHGTLIKFQADTGVGFVDLTESLDYFEVRVNTRFRAVVMATNGVLMYSTVATIYVQEASANPAADAQMREAYEKRQASFARSLALKISPLATQDPIAPTLMVGLEYRLNSEYGLEASYGHQFTALRLAALGLTNGRYDYQYTKYKLELRRYLSPRTKNPNQETYVAGQFFFTPQRYTRYGNNFYRDGRYVTYDRAFVEKDVVGFCLKVGSLWHVGQRWQLEAGLGGGFRYVDVRYDMLNERKVNSASVSQANMFNQIESPGTRINLDVEVVGKIGYVLGQPRQQSGLLPH